ncbi:MAG: bifunctional [glutamine synthetase] adenylyltransferase/[glutamine synthetase]-adenylyl-L-tyrosine phosphorylase [Acidimicrobiales bacterium]|nr:bifunctional [glutamine synthetase] adenylyltransferase/[glutamine synthetase]-adenylyl-L-tyrosine phosphorylase [Acidimicrobiales bacterium]
MSEAVLADPEVAASIERSASPARVRSALERLIEARPDLRDRLVDDRALRDRLIAVTAASRSLTRLLINKPDAVDVLFDLEQREAVADFTADELARWKEREFLRIAARDLTGVDQFEQTVSALSSLAAYVLDAACRIALSQQLAVIGMGKFGGSELNYASDVDIVFVGDGIAEELVKQAREVIGVARRSFRIDTNLRPEGRDGPLVRSLDSYEAYWDRWAQPWEFQALLKARPVAGDRQLGERFLHTAQRWLWSRPFSADDLRSIRDLKQRAEAEVIRSGLAERELKRGPGGIRDIEFTAQILQLVHGQADAGLRSPNTLATLKELADAGYVDPADAHTLIAAYRFLRTIEHRIQLLDEQQVHTVPASAQDRDWLSRVLGYRDTARASATEQFEQELRQHQLAVRRIHERVYFRPLLEAFAERGGTLSPEAAVTRLHAFGFTDTKRTQAAVRELTRGLNRTSRLMQQMLPLMLDWLSASPDPDLGLLLLRTMLSGPQRTTQLVEAFRDSPEVARHLCILLGTSRMLGEILHHNPDLVSRLPYEERLRTRPKAELVESAKTALAWRSDRDSQQDGLRRWKNRHLLGIAARDIFGFSDVDTVGCDLTSLAEACLEAALGTLEPKIPFSVIAMGRFGGGELSYASDLDVIYVYDGSGSAHADEAHRLAIGLTRFISGTTPAGRIYEVDADLRPEGRQGALARSRDGFLKYWRTYAQPWERMAMTRARPVAGDLQLGNELLAQLEPYVWDDGLTGEDIREIRRIKARVERERIPASEDPQFHLKLGRGSLSDVEFTAQLLQLTYGIRSQGTMQALAKLESDGHLTEQDAATLRDSYRFCEQTRNRWYLVNSGPADSLPTAPEQQLWLSRSLGMRPGELREQYRRVTRRARKVVERLFYGRE